MIFPPGSSSALPESPATLEKSPKEAIVAEAKKIVDERLDPQKLMTIGPIVGAANEVIECPSLARSDRQCPLTGRYRG
jgi:hypothetical protein